MQKKYHQWFFRVEADFIFTAVYPGLFIAVRLF